MEQRKKRGRGFAAITLCCLMAFAGLMGAGTKEVQAAEGEGYSFNDGVLTVTGIASNDLSTVNVTESLVNTIESAIDMSTVTKLVIGDDVTHIDANAFKDCGVTGSLELGDSLVSIGYRGFYGCSGLTGDLVIPDSVTYIGESGFGGAFQNCSGFTSLTISNNLAVIPDYTFKGCTGLTGNIVIPESVTKVGVTTEYWGEAFSGCTGITSVTFGSNVEFIGGGAFKGCTGLAGDLVIPDKVTEIGSNAFENCTGLTGTLTLGSGLTKINSTAFSSCGFTGSLVIPDSVTEIGSRAFYKCKSFNGTLTLGNTLETIGEEAFKECAGFTGNLVIPDSVTSLGIWTFADCKGFNGTLTLPNNAEFKKIEKGAFKGCSGLTGNLVIPDSVTEIRGSNELYGAFASCSGFTGLTLGSGLEKISGSVFWGCTGFKDDLVIPDNVTTIENGAFYNCSGFDGTLTLSNNLTVINAGVFENCTGFTGTLVIPEGVTSIYQNTSNNGAFKNSGFEKVVLPSTIVKIEQNAFRNMSRLSEIEKPETLSLASVAPADAFYLPKENAVHTKSTGFTEDEIQTYLYNNNRIGIVIEFNTKTDVTINTVRIFKESGNYTLQNPGTKGEAPFEYWYYTDADGNRQTLSADAVIEITNASLLSLAERDGVVTLTAFYTGDSLVENGANMVISGTVSPVTTLDITIPLKVIELSIGEDRTMEFADKEIVNNSHFPIDVYILNVEGEDGTEPEFVPEDTYTEYEWNNLSKSETLSSISVSMNDNDLSEVFGNTELDSALAIKIGAIKSGLSDVHKIDITTEAQYGKNFGIVEDLSFNYTVVMEFRIP